MAETSNWDLDADHRDFQKVCRAFVTERVAPLVTDAEQNRSVPGELWAEMGRAGLLGLAIPETYGGTDGGALAVAILAEELARASSGIAITPLVSAYMAAPHIVRFGTAEQRHAWLPAIATGSMLAAIAVTEAGAGSDVAALTARATATEDGWRLSGSKMFITNAGLAGIFVIAAKTSVADGHRGISTFLVPAEAPGLSLGAPLDKLGWHSSDTREIVLDEVEVPREALLGGLNRGFYQIMTCFQLERVVLAAMGVGLAAACIDEARSYVHTREAFGARLLDKQTVRHRLATMVVELEAARTLTYSAAARLGNAAPDAERAVAIAKYFAARAANRIADDAVQLFGGAGFLNEPAVTRHYRDARILRIGGGTDEIQLEILAGRLAGE